MLFTIPTLLALVASTSALAVRSSRPQKFDKIDAETSRCFFDLDVLPMKDKKGNDVILPRYTAQIGRPFNDKLCGVVHDKMTNAVGLSQYECIDDGHGNTVIAATILIVDGPDRQIVYLADQKDKKVPNAGDYFHAAYPEIAFDCSKA